MQVRREANPLVSINEPSLEAALISGCTGAALFMILHSLTLLIPNEFVSGRRSSTEIQGYVMKLLSVATKIRFVLCYACVTGEYACKKNDISN